MFQLARSLAALVVALLLISVVIEGIEFLIVAAVHGGVTTDEAVYFGIRNQPLILALKFLYTVIGGLVGGYVAAWLAGRAHVQHAIVLAVTQVVAIIWGATASPLAHTTPAWVWLVILALIAPAIVAGGVWRTRRLAS